MSGLPSSPQMVGHNAMDLVVFLQIHLLKSCPLSVTVYGTCEEVIKIKWGHKWGPNHVELVPLLEEEETVELSLSIM